MPDALLTVQVLGVPMGLFTVMAGIVLVTHRIGNAAAIGVVARICAAVVVMVGSVLPSASAGAFENAPHAIACHFEATQNRPAGLLLFYIDLKVDGDKIYYKTLGPLSQQLTVSSNGVILSRRIAGCHGKTVQELRESGRVFDFK